MVRNKSRTSVVEIKDFQEKKVKFVDDIITMSIKEKKRGKIKIQGTGGEKKFGGCGTFLQ